MEEFSNYETNMIVDKNSNTVTYQDICNRTKISQKAKGYSLVYVDRVKEVALELKSVKNVYIIMDMFETWLSDELTLEIDYKFFMKNYMMSKGASRSLIRLLKKCDVIRPLEGHRGIYRANPYFILPKKGKDELIHQKQLAWDLEFYDWNNRTPIPVEYRDR